MGDYGRRLLAGLLTVFLSAACTQAGLQRAAHDVLQQHTCEQSEPRGSCQRSWHAEYAAWQAQYAAHRAALDESRRVEPPAGPVWHEPPASLVVRER